MESIPLTATMSALLLLLLVAAYGDANSSPEYSSRHSHATARQLHSSDSPAPAPMYNYHPHYHRCYVCLPQDRSSSIYKEIMEMFPGQNVSNCSYFDSQTHENLNPHTQFIFSCPVNSSGCLLRTDGPNVARTCAQFPINDCKSANTIELCYCTGSLCNRDRSKFNFPLPPPPPQVGSRSVAAYGSEVANSNGLFEDGETDDEDLLGPNSDGHGSGFGPVDPSTSEHYPPPNNGVDVESRHNPVDTNRIDGGKSGAQGGITVANAYNIPVLISIAHLVFLFH